MPRHAPHIMVALTVRVPRGRQAFWDIMRRLHRDQGDFSARAVEQETNLHRSTVGDYVRRLVKAGYLEEVRRERRHGPPQPIYRVARDQADAPKLRRDGSPARDLGRSQDQLWRAMKMAARFTPADLALTASTEDCTVTRQTAASYIKHLMAAGYLVRLARGVYRLRPDRNTGPLAPQVYRSDWVFDPNLRQGFGPTHLKEGDR